MAEQLSDGAQHLANTGAGVAEQQRISREVATVADLRLIEGEVAYDMHVGYGEYAERDFVGAVSGVSSWAEFRISDPFNAEGDDPTIDFSPAVVGLRADFRAMATCVAALLPGVGPALTVAVNERFGADTADDEKYISEYSNLSVERGDDGIFALFLDDQEIRADEEYRGLPSSDLRNLVSFLGGAQATSGMRIVKG